MTVSSLLIFMIVLFLALAIFLGTPIAVALGLAAVAELILQGEVPLMIFCFLSKDVFTKHWG